MKKLLPYLSAYKKECILAPLFKMLEAIFELLVPLVVASIIDVGIRGNDRSFVLGRGAWLFALALIGTAAAVTAQFFAARAATGFSTVLREKLFSHMQRLSFSQLDTLGSGTLITRIVTDVNQAQNMVNMFLRLFLRSPFIVLGAMIMAFTVDPIGALVFAVAIPLLFLLVALIMRLTLPMYRKIQGRLDTVTVAAKEGLSGARVIRAFRREKASFQAFEEKNEDLRSLQLLTGRISALTNPLTYVVVNVGIIALLSLGGRRVDEGLLSQGQVVALLNYMSQILVELIKLANLLVTLTRGLASVGRIAEILSMEPENTIASRTPETEDMPKGAASISFCDVSFRYQGAGGDAISGISFSVAPGETLGIIGGTGSGKSTVVQLIPGHYEAGKGRVLIDGRDVKSQGAAALRKRIGMVPQKAFLFEGTVRDNLCFGKEGALDEELWEALDAARAADFVREKGGLDAHIEEAGANLSGGQKQRLTVARALLRKPDILILDDSMSALDAATDRALRKAIFALSPHPTTILVSQRVATLRECDQILVLSEGELLGKGKHEELLSSCPLYGEICRSQSEQ